MKQVDYPNAIRKLRAKVNRWENGHYEPTIIAKVKLKELFKENNIDVEEEKNKKKIE